MDKVGDYFTIIHCNCGKLVVFKLNLYLWVYLLSHHYVLAIIQL